MTSHIQIDGLQNVNYLRSRYLFSLHEEFIYNLYSNDHFVSIGDWRYTVSVRYRAVPKRDGTEKKRGRAGRYGAVWGGYTALPCPWENDTSSDNAFYRISLFALNTINKDFNKLINCWTLVLIFLILLLLS